MIDHWEAPSFRKRQPISLTFKEVPNRFLGKIATFDPGRAPFHMPAKPSPPGLPIRASGAVWLVADRLPSGYGRRAAFTVTLYYLSNLALRPRGRRMACTGSGTRHDRHEIHWRGRSIRALFPEQHPRGSSAAASSRVSDVAKAKAHERMGKWKPMAGSCTAATVASFDPELVGAGEHGGGHREVECLGGFQVDGELELGRQLCRQV